MPKKIISTPAGAEIAHSHQAWENPYRGPAVKFARHQFHIDPLARNVPQLQCFSHRYAQVFLAVRGRDRKRYHDLFSIVRGRLGDALEKCADSDFRVPLVVGQ